MLVSARAETKSKLPFLVLTFENRKKKKNRLIGYIFGGPPVGGNIPWPRARLILFDFDRQGGQSSSSKRFQGLEKEFIFPFRNGST